MKNHAKLLDYLERSRREKSAYNYYRSYRDVHNDHIYYFHEGWSAHYWDCVTCIWMYSIKILNLNLSHQHNLLSNPLQSLSLHRSYQSINSKLSMGKTFILAELNFYYNRNFIPQWSIFMCSSTFSPLPNLVYTFCMDSLTQVR